MDIITGIMVGALAIAFIASVITARFEFGIMALLLTFCAFVAIANDTTIPKDLVMLFYVPVVAMGLFSAGSFFRVKVR